MCKGLTEHCAIRPNTADWHCQAMAQLIQAVDLPLQHNDRTKIQFVVTGGVDIHKHAETHAPAHIDKHTGITY